MAAALLDPPSTVEVFVPPSAEARWLARRFRALLAPPSGVPDRRSRVLGFFVVAPFTQFTLLSWDLQMFLFEVFHTRLSARLGHGLFMPAVNFFVMAALAQLRVGAPPTAHAWTGPSLNGATVYAALLITWYFAVAVRERLLLWWALSAPCTLALALGADAYYCHHATLDAAQRSFFAPTPLAANPFVWMWVSALMIMLSHVPEPRLPPRVSDTWRWTSVADFLRGTNGRPSVAGVLSRGVLLLAQVASGTLNEWWASPRLMPYNLLALMFRAGYQPTRAARTLGFAARAIASGNPAIDFVGVGGGAYLRAEDLG
ncbi:MAG: hypothetical protein U0325_10875 [Polyangiales bacterium]